MAVFHPSLKSLNHLEVRPTSGEKTLIRFFQSHLDDTYEIYFRPVINGDRPDFLLIRSGHGVLLLDVVDRALDRFHIDENRHWISASEHRLVKSPVDRVLKYRQNCYDLHIEGLLEDRLFHPRIEGIITSAVYFHRATQEEIYGQLVRPFEQDRSYQRQLREAVILFGKDGLQEDAVNRIFRSSRCLALNNPLFSGTIYHQFIQLLSPPPHVFDETLPSIYTRKQHGIIHASRLEQRVKGIFGSGKTMALAGRAVTAYRRALERTPDPWILILTYNLTLRNFIAERLQEINADFPPERFIIIDYRSFIRAELNNIGLEFTLPADIRPEERELYLENTYYANTGLFEAHRKEIKVYDAVLIDEIQDYHRCWMDIVKRYFRHPAGDYVLFGDAKQNSYGQALYKKDVVSNVRGVNEFRQSFRADYKVKALALAFQKYIFKDRYERDDSNEDGTFGSLGLRQENIGELRYEYLDGKELCPTLCRLLDGILAHSTQESKGIAVLGCSPVLLKQFDAYYRHVTGRETVTLFESIEIMYRTHFEQERGLKGWLSDIDGRCAPSVLPELFTLQDLEESYPGRFRAALEEACRKGGIAPEKWLDFKARYRDSLERFREEVYSGDYEWIRDNRRFHFTMQGEAVRISTIQDFKGWESETVLLLLEPHSGSNFDELVYTGITRSRKNLIILNYGNRVYDARLRPLIEEING